MKRVYAFICIFSIMFANLVIVTADDAITVTLCVTEQVKNTTLYNKTMELDNSSTALDALIKSGLDVTESKGYVSSVNGYKEFQHGRYSGWTYYVNGNFANISSAKYTLKDGDKVEWIYVVDYPKTTSKIKNNATAENVIKTEIAPSPHETETMQNFSFSTNSEQASKEVKSSQNITNSNSTAITTNISTQTNQSFTTSSNFNANAIEISLDYLKKNSGTFTPLVLSLFRQAISDDVKDSIQEEISTCTEPIMAERLIINAYALGLEVTDDLADKCFNSEQIDKTGLNGVIFGLLAAKKHTPKDKSKYSVQKLTEMLVNSQNADGGFSLTKGDNSDVDITAMAVTALSTVDDVNAKNSMNKALDYLSKAQNKDGGYSSYGVANCESTAQVVIALVSSGVSQNDSRFIKDKSAYECLYNYFNSNGFCHEIGGEVNTISCEQALLAIYAREYNENPYTVAVDLHLEEINFTFIFIGVGALILVCATILIVLTRKGKK